MQSFVVRKIESSDYSKALMDVFEGLTKNVGFLSFNDFEAILCFWKLHPETYFNYVIHDTKEDLIIGTASMFIEQKLIHSGGKVAHIEDVVIKKEYQRKGLGKMLLSKLVDIAKRQECYKVILDCNNENIPFYEKLGFVQKENQMALYV